MSASSASRPTTYRLWFPSALLLLALLLGTVALARVSAQTTVHNDLGRAFDMIGELNAWRLEAGLSPLRPNETLMKMAFFQADYLMSLRSIPDGPAIHRGRNGEGVRARARYSQFDWPYYSRQEHIAIGEIAAVFPLNRAMAFWRSSPPHFNTITNPAYREIGVAAIPRQFNTLYVVVFGARPNVLPAFIHPETNQLHLTRDEYGPAVHHITLVNPLSLRLFDADGRPLDNDWRPWQPVIDLPDTSSQTFHLLYTDGQRMAMTRVNRERDILILPGYQPPLESFSFAPTSTPAPTATPPPPTPTPIPRPALTLIYDETTLTIINTSGRNLNLSPFTLAVGDFNLPMSWWREVSNFPLGEFPPRHCLQISVEGVSQPLLPSECQLSRARRNIRPPVIHFWAEEFFVVRANRRMLATCEASAGRCEVFLP